MLEEGKLPWNTLSRLLGYLPTRDPDLVVGPGLGEDAGVFRAGDGFLVVHTDPITAAVQRIGWYAVHVAANDVAVRGVKPRWFLPVILLSPTMNPDDIERVFRDMGRALSRIGGVVVGGHTEVSPGLDHPVVSVTAIGYTRGRVVLTRDARPGDKLLLTGRPGGEGAAVLAIDYRDKLVELGIGRDVLDRASSFLEDISVVDTALSLARLGVDAMHDPTEGGVIQAVHEMAAASGTCASINPENTPVDPAVHEITSRIGIDPLRLLSSGSLIAAVPPSRVHDITAKLDDLGVSYSVIGDLKKCPRPGLVEVRGRGGVSIVEEDVVDEIYRAIRILGGE